MDRFSRSLRKFGRGSFNMTVDEAYSLTLSEPNEASLYVFMFFAKAAQNTEGFEPEVTCGDLHNHYDYRPGVPSCEQIIDHDLTLCGNVATKMVTYTYEAIDGFRPTLPVGVKVHTEGLPTWVDVDVCEHHIDDALESTIDSDGITEHISMLSYV